MSPFRIVVLLLVTLPLFSWSLQPDLQVGPNPPRGAHIEYRSYPAAGCTLIAGKNSMVLPAGSSIVLKVWTFTPRWEFPVDDTLQVVSL